MNSATRIPHGLKESREKHKPIRERFESVGRLMESLDLRRADAHWGHEPDCAVRPRPSSSPSSSNTCGTGRIEDEDEDEGFRSGEGSLGGRVNKSSSLASSRSLGRGGIEPRRTAGIDRVRRRPRPRVGSTDRQALATFSRDSPAGHAPPSSDGWLVVTVSEDRTARVWDLASGNPLTAAQEQKRRLLAGWDAACVATPEGPGLR